MSILAINAGAAYQIESLLGERYCTYFNKVVRPEELGEVDLSAFETLLIPCRTPSHRLIAHRQLFQAHLENGGTIIAMGECHSERWLSNIVFTPLETNFWWWLDPQGDLGLQIKSPLHPLFRLLGPQDLAWHLHGFFSPPVGSEVLIEDNEGRAILYIDEVTTKGRLIVTSLDPFFHHGHHFMPATTRFLDGFLKWLKQDMANSAD